MSRILPGDQMSIRGEGEGVPRGEGEVSLRGEQETMNLTDHVPCHMLQDFGVKLHMGMCFLAITRTFLGQLR